MKDSSDWNELKDRIVAKYSSSKKLPTIANIVELFKESLGEKNAYFDKISIVLKFNCKNPDESDRFQRFGGLTAKNGIKPLILSQENLFTVHIPVADGIIKPNLRALHKIASQMAVRTGETTIGERQ